MRSKCALPRPSMSCPVGIWVEKWLSPKRWFEKVWLQVLTKLRMFYLNTIRLWPLDLLISDFWKTFCFIIYTDNRRRIGKLETSLNSRLVFVLLKSAQFVHFKLLGAITLILGWISLDAVIIVISVETSLFSSNFDNYFDFSF